MELPFLSLFFIGILAFGLFAVKFNHGVDAEHRKPRKQEQNDNRQNEGHGKRVVDVTTDEAVRNQLRQEAEHGQQKVFFKIKLHRAVDLAYCVNWETRHKPERQKQNRVCFHIGVHHAAHALVFYQKFVHDPAAQMLAPKIFNRGKQRKADNVNQNGVRRLKRHTGNHANGGNRQRQKRFGKIDKQNHKNLQSYSFLIHYD